MRLSLNALLMSAVIAGGLAERPAEAQTPPPPARYSLPWQLRPMAIATVVRSDTSVAFYEKDANSGDTIVTGLIASYKLTPEVAPLIRVAFVANQAPVAPGTSSPMGTALVNPLLGATFASKLSPSFKGALFAAVTIPVGQGGGDTPAKDKAAAAASGVAARSAMDNAMFAVNYVALIGGASVAYIADDLTIQAEITGLQLMRARGPEVNTDASRTNFTSGIHAGYFIIPELSVGTELRYQRWLSYAAPVRTNELARETVTFAIGPRGHFQLGNGMWMRPGISYSRGLDQPLSGGKYQMVQIDLPFVF